VTVPPNLMTLQDSVREVFAQGGQLTAVIEEFRPRQGQVDMALAIARAVENGGALVVEAGTGIGKTFAYLVPALLSGGRVLVSTATKALQDQLFGRDLPLLVKTLGLPARIALLKGRSSYLCLHRLAQARQDVAVANPMSLRALGKVEQWAHATVTGDLAEMKGLYERSPLIPLVTSTRENCLGSQCPQFRACHVNLARRDALAADIVVINHHLFFADMAVRESGMAELLPTVNTVIFDEAHQLNEIGVQFLGRFVTTGQLLDCARDILATGLSLARGLANWNEVSAELELASRELRLVAGSAPAGGKIRWLSAAPDQINEADWLEVLSAVAAACENSAKALGSVADTAPDFIRLKERVLGIKEGIAKFLAPCAAGSVRWLDVGAQLRLVESPLNIASAVQSKLLHQESQEVSSRSWIFTSATLGDDAQLSWFTEPCGLADAEILKVQSPFNYAEQAGIYVPRSFPKPADPQHSQAVAELVAKAADIIGGRALVLTTTLKALRAISDALKLQFRDSQIIEILVQGQLPKRELMERFRVGDQCGRPGCILVASASFWEGIDVPGDALQLVVIDKLPFPPPSDPMVEARSIQLEQAGKSSFSSYSLPEAAVALKQGAGRLIRRESDQGLLVVCDSRLVSMGYGKRLLAALPAMKTIASEADFLDALDALGTSTKSSTMDSNPA
jgi:ATP-dependent DNA helicase DinG